MLYDVGIAHNTLTTYTRSTNTSTHSNIHTHYAYAYTILEHIDLCVMCFCNNEKNERNMSICVLKEM